MNHLTKIEHYEDLYEIAQAISQLRYDKLADFLDYLGNMLLLDAEKDLRRNRPRLSYFLRGAASDLRSAAVEIDGAWDIAEEYEEE